MLLSEPAASQHEGCDSVLSKIEINIFCSVSLGLSAEIFFNKINKIKKRKSKNTHPFLMMRLNAQ
tara:strand:- start:198 stop:392 length:195 start_codon:yes stop_codon:yes gene_type:complete